MAPLLLWMALSAPVAQDSWSPVSDPRPDSMEGLARDLRGADASRRRFAVRELNRIARVSRKHEFGSLDAESTMDALQKLKFLDDYVASICIEHLEADLEVRGCARLLGHLEAVAARPVVAAARARTERRNEARLLDRTLSILDAAQPVGAP